MNKSRLRHAVTVFPALFLCRETAGFGSSFRGQSKSASLLLSAQLDSSQSVTTAGFGVSPQRYSTFASRLYAQADSSQDTAVMSNVLPENVTEQKIHLDTGIEAQVFVGRPSKPTKLPPLVFLHGSFHAGWCWTERFFPYFIDLGYPVAALSLRGTGGTFAGEGVKKVKINEHAEDLKSFLDQVSDLVESDEKPILISHSFGGLAVMKLLEQNPEGALNLGGIIIMCSVPPSGNGPMTLRFLKRSLKDSWKITAGFAMKRCIQNDSLCRDLFFGGTDDDNGVSDDDVTRYQSYFARDTEAVIDIKDLLKNLPAKEAVDGKAPHLDQFPQCLVIGAERDFIVDREGVEETAAYFGITESTFVDSPHDVMLGRNWENAAKTIQDWVQGTLVNKK